MENKYVLMVHGGAGAVSNNEAYREGMKRALQEGERILQSGGSALDAVERSVSVLEDDPVFNAGKGSVLNEDGEVEMDASIMEGKTLHAGAVAGVRGVKNPVSLARAVMEKTQHVFLIGDGAMAFAKSIGAPHMPNEYFLTDARIKQLAEAKKSDHVVLDHSSVSEKKYGTVGAVARDKNGMLAAATSTGGIVNKKFGRVGDTPLIGAGTYADNTTCAVSATGFGEQFIRTVLAKTIADLVEYRGLSASDAAKAGIACLVEKVQGLGGVIVIDAKGGYGSAYSTPGLAHGFVTEGESPQCHLK